MEESKPFTLVHNVPLISGNREFYSFPRLTSNGQDHANRALNFERLLTTTLHNSHTQNEDITSSEELCRFINDSMIGKNLEFQGPFGSRKVLYADFIASGRSLNFIESFINEEVLPHYANTHTTTSITALQISLYRQEAKDIVRNAVRASERDAVIFVGSGSTGAISKLTHSLSLKRKPVVIVGNFEHHSNLLPWRHLSERWYRIKTTIQGALSLDHLESLLKIESVKCKEEDRDLLVSISAASNVTGILTDIDDFAALTHAYDGLIFVDYATAAPYIKIDMNPVYIKTDKRKNYRSELIHKDAIFFSCHKFIGGPQSSGVLIVKKDLLTPSEICPEMPGGGSVFLVSREQQFYLSNAEYREEAGTPAIVEDIRSGLVFKLKESVGIETILSREYNYLDLMWKELTNVDCLHILGNKYSPRLPILSFVISFDKWPNLENQDKRRVFLHHNFIAALLNDLFGIQCRGGCACAGPYALDLLGIEEDLAIKLVHAILGTEVIENLKNDNCNTEDSSYELLRPGFVRLSFPYFMSLEEVNFILKAVKFVCKYGWIFLPLYKAEQTTGTFVHQEWNPLKNRKWLHRISFSGNSMTFMRPKSLKLPSPSTFEDCLKEAERLMDETKNLIQTGHITAVDNSYSYVPEIDNLRWYLLPCEAIAVLLGTTSTLVNVNPASALFWPKIFSLSSVTSSETLTLESVQYEQSISNKSKFKSCKDESKQACIQSYDNSNNTTALNMRYHYSGVWDSNDLRLNEFSSGKSELKANKEQSIAFEGIKLSTFNCKMRGNFSNNSKATTEKKIQKWKLSLCKAMEKDGFWRNPMPVLFKQFLKGVRQFDMLRPGDRVLVCLSGGKDSLSLLHCIHQYQTVLRREYAKMQGISPEEMNEQMKLNKYWGTFEFAAVTVDPGSSSYDPSPLIDYMKQLDVIYFYEKQDVIQQASQLPTECSSICAFCSRMKRGRIYATAKRAKYNVIALGQHLDDLVESFFMSAFHQGALNTMKANYFVKTGDLRVIRPLVFVREWQTRKFAKMAQLPVIPENCPACFEAPKERFRLKRLLAEQETIFPRLYDNLRNVLIPLMSNNRALGLNAQQNVAFAMSLISKKIDKNVPITFNLSDSE